MSLRILQLLKNRPYSWDFLLEYVEWVEEAKKEQDTFDNNLQLARHPLFKDDYKIHKAELKAKGLAVYQYIINTIFSDPNLSVTLEPNPYPYDIGSEIEHWLLWFYPKKYGNKSPINNQIAKELITSYLDRPVFKEKYDAFTFYENPLSWKTVPELPHFHVFLRKTKI